MSITFGESNSEGGLRFVDFQQDGPTVATNFQSQPCRALKLASRGSREGYVYLAVDPLFKRKKCSQLRVQVEYFDLTNGVFDIEYNSLDPSAGGFNAYGRSLKQQHLSRTMAWQNAEFRLKHVFFRNAQNGQADLRLRVMAPAFLVRQVTLLREDAFEKPARSGTLSTVSIRLGLTNDEHGLTQVYDQGDGLTAPALLDGVDCRKLVNKRNWGYVYFAIDPAFKTTNLITAEVEVEYFDDKGTFELQYDKNGKQNGAYTKTPNRVVLRGSQTWKTGQFLIKNALLDNSQNGDADFRLWSPLPDLHLRRVTVRRL